MVIASHVIFGAYGFWLPNDPRGSWSEFVGAYELYRYGPATTTSDTASVAHRPHNRELRLAAKESLKHPPVNFTGVQARAVGAGFARYAASAGLAVWACVILPDHVHLVVARHAHPVESLVVQLKGNATRKLIGDNLHPFGDLREKNGRVPKCFARGEWKVFLDSMEVVERAIRYVENNPVKEGRPAQRWTFVVPPTAV